VIEGSYLLQVAMNLRIPPSDSPRTPEAVSDEPVGPHSVGQSSKRFTRDHSIDSPRKKSSKTHSIDENLESLTNVIKRAELQQEKHKEKR
jgi:hypothetical protein